MFIDPTGTIRMTSCGDQIHAGNLFHCWGTSLPQVGAAIGVGQKISLDGSAPLCIAKRNCFDVIACYN